MLIVIFLFYLFVYDRCTVCTKYLMQQDAASVNSAVHFCLLIVGKQAQTCTEFKIKFLYDQMFIVSRGYIYTVYHATDLLRIVTIQF